MTEQNKEPKLCQVCGFDTAKNSEGVYISRCRNGDELLALLCIECWARGNLWAAKQSLPKKIEEAKSKEIV